MPETVSVTGLVELATCPLRYHLSYIQGWRGRHAAGRRAFGGLVHAVLASLFQLPPQHRTRTAVAAVAHRMARQLDDDRSLRPMARALETRAVAIWDLIDPARVVVIPDGVERPLSSILGGMTIRGRADLVFRVAGSVVIADFKTGDAPRQPDTGELYPGVRSRSAHGLPVRPLASDDPFFALKTYATLLQGTGDAAQGEVGLELLYLSPPARVSTRITAAGRQRHIATLNQLVHELRTGVEQGTWEARHGAHCRACPFRLACPLLKGDAATLDEAYASVLQRAGLHRVP